MPSATFDLEEKRLVEAVQSRKAKLVLIQLPEGLKPHGPQLAATVEGAGAVAIVSADPCYGACDLAIAEAERLGADLIIHYGHSEMVKQTACPTVYIHAEAQVSVREAVKAAISHLKPWKKVGLLTTIQHVHVLDEARKTLSKAGKLVTIGDAGRLPAGHVLGCDYTNAKVGAGSVDAFLFIGGGRFHALGAALATGKPTIVADPYEKRAFSVTDEAARLVRKRWANIYEAKQAQKIGILVGLKAGQKRLDQALRTKKELDDARRESTLFALREIIPEALMQFPSIDAFVNTACPRLTLDDAGSFRKPLLTPREMQVALGKLQWEELCRRGWFESET
jgi:2-(3-amino-3-carboxypropyl)histidine synthase